MARPLARALRILVLAAPLAGCPRPPSQASGVPLPASASAREVRVGSTPPVAEVVIAGQPRCTTPCALRLDPGRYRVLVRKTGFLPVETDLLVGAEGEASLEVSLVSSH